MLYYFQFNLLTYPYPVDSPDTPPEPQPTVIERNQGQPEDKPPSGTTLYNHVQMHANFLLLHYCKYHCTNIALQYMEGNFSGENIGEFGKSFMIHQTKIIQISTYN